MIAKECGGLVLDLSDQNEESKEDAYLLVHLGGEDVVNNSSSSSDDKDDDNGKI